MIPVSASGFWEIVLAFASGVIVLPFVFDFVVPASQQTPVGDDGEEDSRHSTSS
jgi:hypothetical protein